MSLNPAWRPPEDNVTILTERTWLAGVMVACVAYGIVFTLFILSFKQVVQTTTKANRRSKIPLLLYITLIFTCGTIFIGSGAKMIKLGFIDYRLIPGGPAAFQTVEFSTPVNKISTVAYVFTNWLADGIVVWRCIVIFRGTRCPEWLVMVIPLLAYLTSVSLGIAWLVQVSAPTSSPWSPSKGINVTLPYFWLSLALNITMTLAICARLCMFRWRICRVMGPKHGSHYTSIAAMCVESALIYSVFALCFLVPFSVNHPIQYVFLQVLGEAQIIAPLLITYRVACGEAWSSKTRARLYDTTQKAADVELQPIEFLVLKTENSHSMMAVPSQR